MTDRVTTGRTLGQLSLCILVADSAREAGVQGALPLRVGVVQTLLTYCVMVMGAVRIHALSHRAHGAQLTLLSDLAEEKVVVTDADGIVGVGAGRLHAHHACALSTGLALLCVTVVL